MLPFGIDNSNQLPVAVIYVCLFASLKKFFFLKSFELEKLINFIKKDSRRLFK